MAEPLDAEAFIRANTAREAPPLVPEVTLHLATELVPIWRATEDDLEKMGLPPPYWAFAWAGGQALARYILDNPETVSGKRVLDFASGSGLVAVAAARAGAGSVTANDIDPYAIAAIRANAAANGVEIAASGEDVIESDAAGWDVVLAGDICYEQPLADRVAAWLRGLAAAGKTVLIGDPGRTYLPKEGLEWVVRYAVKTTRELEDTDVRNAVVWRFAATDGDFNPDRVPASPARRGEVRD
ncbi:MAG: 50S ribosomal protein L11 methyltransferase [Alphaproteobacteria bacterium]|nr:50S ribosomal protein L11 methyltransferase [Alphaproteobacteria bacterium]